MFFDKKTWCTSRAPYCIEIIINVFCFLSSHFKKKKFDWTLPCHLIRLSKNVILNALNVYVYHSVQLHVMIKIIKLQKKDILCFKLHNCVAKRQIVMLKKGIKWSFLNLFQQNVSAQYHEYDHPCDNVKGILRRYLKVLKHIFFNLIISTIAYL